MSESTPPVTEPVLELRGVSAGYGPFRALFDVSLAIGAGEAVALVGPNGAGKTTVARVASGLVAPTGGAVLVEVGRALMTQPRLVLLDEPSSGLDRGETASLAKTLREVQEDRGFAILLVEHDIELVASFTTRSYLLDFGRMIASGATAEVMASREMRHAYLGDLEVPT